MSGTTMGVPQVDTWVHLAGLSRGRPIYRVTRQDIQAGLSLPLDPCGQTAVSACCGYIEVGASTQSTARRLARLPVLQLGSRRLFLQPALQELSASWRLCLLAVFQEASVEAPGSRRLALLPALEETRGPGGGVSGSRRLLLLPCLSYMTVGGVSVLGDSGCMRLFLLLCFWQ